jgi:hypothetical protein
MRLTAFYLSVALLALGICSSPLSSCVSAQEKTNAKSNDKASTDNVLEENKFKEILAKATANLEGKIYRSTKTEEYFPDREANSESVKTNILEVIPPDKTRVIEQVKSRTENTRLERLGDGQNLYEKRNDGEWGKYSGGSSISGDITSGRTTTIYRLTGKESVNGKPADVYQVESRRIANKLTQTSQYRVEYVVKTKYWIGENGLFLKIVKESEVVGSKSLTREITVYEYDLNIKIEAPIR